jgi:hypothetical protein
MPRFRWGPSPRPKGRGHIEAGHGSPVRPRGLCHRDRKVAATLKLAVGEVVVVFPGRHRDRKVAATLKQVPPDVSTVVVGESPRPKGRGHIREINLPPPARSASLTRLRRYRNTCPVDRIELVTARANVPAPRGTRSLADALGNAAAIRVRRIAAAGLFVVGH